MASAPLVDPAPRDATSTALAAWRADVAAGEQQSVAAALTLWHMARTRAPEDASLTAQERLAHASLDTLAALKFDSDTLAAALLAALPHPHRPNDAHLRDRFGAGVATLVQGALRLGQVDAGASGERAHGKVSLENLRKLLLAIAQDVRVVIIALAQRIALMREAAQRAESERMLLGQQTLDLFAPLANRLGMWQLKWELEDLAFRCIEPDLYQTLVRELDETRAERERYIAHVIAALTRELKTAGLTVEVSGRPKHIYSIHQKMQRKHLALADVHDVRALRVLVAEVKDCYTALGVVHNLWQPVPGEFDDYISKPKDNLYRSLHTAVVGPEGNVIEVQIRTHEMHRSAELGIAAHWRYKESGLAAAKADSRSAKADEQIAWLRQVLSLRNDFASRSVDAERGGALFDDTVFVLTPQGKVLDLPKGATPVDFAYELHTELGHRCRGAKVDGHIVPLNYRLQNAQHVEIISVKQGGPSRDWLAPALGYLHTSRALAKVRQWFKQQEHAEQIAHGRTLLDKELQRAGATGINLETLAARLQLGKPEDVFAALARGELSSRQVQSGIAPETAQKLEVTLPASNDPGKTAPRRAQSSAVLVLGVDNLSTQIAKCCKPLPPEPIVGFIRHARGVIVHRAGCPNIKTLTGEQIERVMPAEWGKLGSTRFPVEVVVEAHDRQGLLRDVSETFTREKVNVLGARTATRGDYARMHFSIEVSGAEQLQQVFALLREVNGVQVVGRKL